MKKNYSKLIAGIKMPYVRSMESYFDDSKGKKVNFLMISEGKTQRYDLKVKLMSERFNHNRVLKETIEGPSSKTESDKGGGGGGGGVSGGGGGGGGGSKNETYEDREMVRQGCDDGTCFYFYKTRRFLKT